MLRIQNFVPVHPTVRSKSRKSLWDSPVFIIYVAVVRITCVISWTGCVIYATYSLYLAGEEFLTPGERNPKRNPGPFSSVFNRARDPTDEEWRFFMNLFVTNLFYWFLIYIVTSYILANYPIQVRIWTWILIASAFVINLMGWRSLLFLLQQPLIYSILLVFRSKTLIWISTILFLYLINFQWFTSLYIDDGYLTEYYFLTIVSWNFARCLSFCFDCWDRSRYEISLLDFISYCMYFPTIFTGPLVLYSTFERDILQQQGQRGKLTTLCKKLFYTGCILALCEIVVHWLYFRRMTFNLLILRKANLWALGGMIFWSGQFFMLKYMVIYGVSTNIAEFEGLEMPPLPKCPSHIHRYSVIWKDFDRGLYNFLVKYIYVPSIHLFEQSYVTKRIHPELKKLCSSILTFSYIYIWHGISPNVRIWAIFNCIGITMERFGSYLKKIMSSEEIHHMVWDFILEPILTVPLAAMSILNSSVFLCNREAAVVFTQRFWNTWQQNYTIPILFCLTHVAVAFRTLPSFLQKLKKR